MMYIIRSLQKISKSNFPLFLFTLLLTFVNFILFFSKGANVHIINHSIVIVFYTIAALAHAFILTLCLYVLFFSVPYLLVRKEKMSVTIYTIAAIVFQIFLIIDISVFNIYKFHINSEIINIAVNNGGSVFVFSTSMWIQFILAVVCISIIPYLVVLKFRKYTIKWFTGKKIQLILSVLVASGLTTMISFIISLNLRDERFEIALLQMPLLYAKTTKSIINKVGLNPISEIEKKLFLESMSDMKFPANELVSNDSIQNYNIVYIVVDSWNPSTFNAQNTKNVYTFAKNKGNAFLNHYSSCNTTVGAIYTLFFGIPRIYILDTRPKKIYPPLLEKLNELNYEIAAFPSSDFTYQGMNEDVFGRFKNIPTVTEGATSFERDANLTKNTIDFLKKRDTKKPFFAFLFYDLPHAIALPNQYNKPYPTTWSEPNYSVLSNKFDRTPFFNLYKNCVFQTDSMIGDVLRTLESTNALKNTIVVITGDHGQEFNENKMNYWGHVGNFSEWQLKVPFIFYYPDIKPGERYEHMTTHFDLSPTILSRFYGIKNPVQDYSLGEDLYDDTSRYPLISQSVSVHGGIIDKDLIISTFPLQGLYRITDRQLNNIDKSKINIDTLVDVGLAKRNRFFTKEKNGFYY